MNLGVDAMNVFFSFDDVWRAMYQLNRHAYNSIFDNLFFAFLRFLHKKYGCKVDLYIVAEHSKFTIYEMTDRYRNEFQENSDWLHFGFHCVSLSNTRPNYEEFIEAFIKTKKSIIQFAGIDSLSKVIRIHGFYGNDEILDRIKSAGIEGLLCADDDRISYNLNEELNNKLIASGFLSHNGMNYYRTDVRIENMKNEDLDKYAELEKVIAFTHEWLFFRRGPFLCFKINRFMKKMQNIK